MSPMSQGRKSPQEQLAGRALIHTASVCPLPFSFWLLPRLCELLSPYTGSWGLKLNPAHSVLCSSSYHYKCTLPEKTKKKKEKNLKKGMESSRNPIFAKLLHGEIISLFLFFFFWEKTEGKINKFLQLNKHTERYSSRQRADNPNLKGTNKLCNTTTARKSGLSWDLYSQVSVLHIRHFHSCEVGEAAAHLWETGRKMGKMWLKEDWAWPQQPGNPEHQIKEGKWRRSCLQL